MPEEAGKQDSATQDLKQQPEIDPTPKQAPVQSKDVEKATITPDQDKTQDQSSEQTNEPEAVMHEIKSGGTNSYFVAIGLAVVFALVLIGFGIVAFSEDETQKSSDSVNQAQQTELEQGSTNQQDATEQVDTTQPVTESDLDSEIQEIDNELNSLDEDDFDDSELSDESLDL